MGAESGSQGAAVALHALARALLEEPTSFDFFQLVRVLERLNPERSPVGRFADPAGEVVRFSVRPAIGFPPSDVRSLEVPDGEPARMSVSFMGLTGPSGVLPYHYSLLLADRQRARDDAPVEFLDLFHHRLVSLFYRAWEKHKFTVARERGGEDRLRDHVLDLVGAGLDEQRERLPLPADALASYAGLLAPQQRSAAALEQLLEDYFGVPVEVEQFVGGWHALPRRDRCALGEESGAADRLGLGAVAGDEVWDQQSRVRIRLGPLSREQYDAFLPTGAAHEPLRALTRFFGHGQFEFEAQLVLEREDVPGCVLGAADDAAQPLGWTTWIRSAPFARDADETVLTL